LQQQFLTLPEEERIRTHQVAAISFQKFGDPKKAFPHLIQSKNFKKALKLFLEDVDNLLYMSNYDAIIRKIKAFPENLRKSNPILRYYYSIVTNLTNPILSRKTLLEIIPYFRDTGDWLREAKIYELLLTNYLFYQESKEQVLNIIKKCKDFLELVNTAISSEKREILEIFIQLGHCWAMPESEKAFEIALKAEETSIKLHDERALLFSRIILSRLLLDRGKFYESKNILEMTEKHLSNSDATRHYELLLRYYLGDTYFYLGEIESAIAQVKRGLESTFYNISAIRYLELNHALYLLYLKNIEEAENIIESICGKEVGDNLMLRYYSIYLLQMLLSYRKNNTERARYYCNRLMNPENEILLMTDYPYSYLALAEVNIFLKNFHKAIQVLRKITKNDLKEKYPYPYVTGLALLGICYHKIGKKTESKKYLQNMVNNLKKKGYQNLDICNPGLLQELSALANKTNIIQRFPRLVELKKSEISLKKDSFILLKTFGELNIIVDDQELPFEIIKKYRKSFDILKKLIIHKKRGIPKDVLYEKFWRGYSQKSLKNNLNTAISRIRRILKRKDIIINRGDTIILNHKAYKLDIDEFLENINRGTDLKRIGKLEDSSNYYLKAISLYKGDFLQNDLYDDEIRDEREHLRNTYQSCLFELIKIYLSLGDYINAISVAKKLIKSDPLSEAGYRMLMIASVLSGNKSEVIKIFNAIERKLISYYGISPDTKTIKLKETLLTGTLPSPSLWINEVYI